MPLFQIDIQKELGGEYWTNVYRVETATLADAADLGLDIAAAERSIMLSSVVQEKLRASTVTPGDDIYTIVPIEQPGVYDPASGTLPLFNTVRVDFGAATGRPGRKYLRGCLSELNIAGDVLTTTFRGAVQSNYADVLLAIPELRHVDGQTYVSATVISLVQMRQLRRGSRRRTEPVI